MKVITSINHLFSNQHPGQFINQFLSHSADHNSMGIIHNCNLGCICVILSDSDVVQLSKDSSFLQCLHAIQLPLKFSVVAFSRTRKGRVGDKSEILPRNKLVTSFNPKLTQHNVFHKTNHKWNTQLHTNLGHKCIIAKSISDFGTQGGLFRSNNFNS